MFQRNFIQCIILNVSKVMFHNMQKNFNSKVSFKMKIYFCKNIYFVRIIKEILYVLPLVILYIYLINDFLKPRSIEMYIYTQLYAHNMHGGV